MIKKQAMLTRIRTTNCPFPYNNKTNISPKPFTGKAFMNWHNS